MMRRDSLFKRAANPGCSMSTCAVICDIHDRWHDEQVSHGETFHDDDASTLKTNRRQQTTRQSA
jgi:hypothetical protein